jgi:type IV pilus assembly protein PilC
MASFAYRVAREDGSILERRVASENEGVLRGQLTGEGYLVLSITEVAKGFSAPSFSRRGVSARNFLAFNQELMVLLKAGLPILKIMDILMERRGEPRFSEALMAVREEVRNGSTIADAMEKQPDVFSEIYVSSLRAGEKSGNLIEVIGRFMAYQRRVLDVQKKVRGAFAYPAFLLIFSILVLSFLITFVLPKFTQMYADSGSELPGLTRALLGFVHLLKDHGLLLLGLLALIAFGAHRAYQSRWGRERLDRIIMQTPGLGLIVQRHYLIRISRTLSTVLKSGIPLVAALKILTDAMDNRRVRDKMESVVEGVRAGGGLALALAQTSLFPRLSIEMLSVGEQTSAIEEMLDNVASFHEEELDLYLARVTTWVEPVLLLGVGAMIAVILMAMYLPIFNLSGVVQ